MPPAPRSATLRLAVCSRHPPAAAIAPASNRGLGWQSYLTSPSGPEAPERRPQLRARSPLTRSARRSSSPSRLMPTRSVGTRRRDCGPKRRRSILARQFDLEVESRRAGPRRSRPLFLAVPTEMGVPPATQFNGRQRGPIGAMIRLGGRDMSKIVVASIGFSVACLWSYFMATHTVRANRRAEGTMDERSSILYIRDDIGAIHNLTVITNGLLAAILATILF